MFVFFLLGNIESAVPGKTSLEDEDIVSTTGGLLVVSLSILVAEEKTRAL